MVRHLARAILPRATRRKLRKVLAARVKSWFHGSSAQAFQYQAKADGIEFQSTDVCWFVSRPRNSSALIWLDNHPEDRHELQVFVKLARAADGILFDVGANIGSFTMLFCKVTRHEAVAFEPSASAASLIKQTAARNGIPCDRIRVIEVAVASENGRAEMNLDEKTGFAHGQRNTSSKVPGAKILRWRRQRLMRPGRRMDERSGC